MPTLVPDFDALEITVIKGQLVLCTEGWPKKVLPGQTSITIKSDLNEPAVAIVTFLIDGKRVKMGTQQRGE